MRLELDHPNQAALVLPNTAHLDIKNVKLFKMIHLKELKIGTNQSGSSLRNITLSKHCLSFFFIRLLYKPLVCIGNLFDYSKKSSSYWVNRNIQGMWLSGKRANNRANITTGYNKTLSKRSMNAAQIVLLKHVSRDYYRCRLIGDNYRRSLKLFFIATLVVYVLFMEMNKFSRVNHFVL